MFTIQLRPFKFALKRGGRRIISFIYIHIKVNGRKTNTWR